MTLPLSITHERALTVEEAGVLARAVKRALDDAWTLLYGYELGGGVGDIHPIIGTLRANDQPGAMLRCYGTSDPDAPQARFDVTISSEPKDDPTD